MSDLSERVVFLESLLDKNEENLRVARDSLMRITSNIAALSGLAAACVATEREACARLVEESYIEMNTTKMQMRQLAAKVRARGKLVTT